MTDTALRIFNSITLDENQVGVIITALKGYGYDTSKMSGDMSLMETSRRHNTEMSELAFATARVLHEQVDLE